LVSKTTPVKTLLPSHLIPIVFKKGRRVVCGVLVAFILPNQGGQFRYRVVIPKNAIPLATDRHKTKRQISELLRKTINRSIALDCVVICKYAHKNLLTLIKQDLPKVFTSLNTHTTPRSML
jgi:ribonuclease P protein component